MPDQSHTEQSPSIPDHTLIRRIGQGSCGDVWLARNALGTCRAVKIVRRGHFDHDRPFEREFIGIKKSSTNTSQSAWIGPAKSSNKSADLTPPSSCSRPLRFRVR